jgi:hypothetical protein
MKSAGKIKVWRRKIFQPPNKMGNKEGVLQNFLNFQFKNNLQK